MKYFIPLLSLLLLVFSCKKSDSSVSERIIGDWQIYSFVVNSCPDGSGNVPQTFANENGCIESPFLFDCTRFSFHNDGKVEVFYDGGIYTEEYTYSIEEEDNEIILRDEGGYYYGTYHLTDGMLSTEMDEGGCLCVFEYENLD